MNATRLGTLVAVAGLLGACSWDPAAELEERRIVAEVDHLTKVKEALSNGGAALRTDLEFFLSKGALEQALTQIGPVEIPLKGAGDAVLRISNTRVLFANGYPEIQLDATVSSQKRGISAECKSHAVLFVDTSKGSLDKSTVRLVIRDLAPSITIPFYRFDLKGFWKDVAVAAAQHEVDRMPSFSLPLSATMPASFGGSALGMTIPTGNGSTVRGNLSVPAINSTVTLELKQVLFLEDGLHLYLNAKVKS